AAGAVVGVLREGPRGLAADGEAARALARRVGEAIPAAAQGARRLRGRRPVAPPGCPRLPPLQAPLMRIALLDPPSFTAPYDHALASALARRGHDVTLLTSPLTHRGGRAPGGYAA